MEDLMSSKDDVGKSVSTKLKCLGRKWHTGDPVSLILQKVMLVLTQVNVVEKTEHIVSL